MLSKDEVFHSGAKVVIEIIGKGKPTGDKRDLGYVNESSTRMSGKTNFVKAKKVFSAVQTSNTTMSTYSFCHRYGCTSDKCHIRKFKEFHRQINKLVVESKELKDKILFLIEKEKKYSIGSKASTQAKSTMNIHYDFHIGTSNSFFRVPKTRQIWIMKDALVELQSKGQFCSCSTPLDSLYDISIYIFILSVL